MEIKYLLGNCFVYYFRADPPAVTDASRSHSNLAKRSPTAPNKINTNLRIMLDTGVDNPLTVKLSNNNRYSNDYIKVLRIGNN